MKKRIAILVVFALLATGAFAQISLSAGGGLLFDYSGRNGIKYSWSGDSLEIGLKNTSFGGFGFFDATYVELGVAFVYGSLKGYQKGSGYSSSTDASSILQLNLSLLGKYPFKLGRVVLFPLLGISYNVVLSYNDEPLVIDSVVGPIPVPRPDAIDLSQFGILGGTGMDFGINDKLYLRAEALFQFRFASKYTKDIKDTLDPLATVFGGTLKNTVGMGPVIKIGVGYKF